MDAAQEFFIHEVDPCTRAFLQDFACVWKGRCAAIMLTHTADHVWHARPADRNGTCTEEALRRQLSDRCDSYRLLWDVTNASKHSILRPRRQNEPLISDASDIGAAQPEFGALPWGEFRWGNPTQVIIQLKDGSLRSLDRHVMRVHGTWCERLALRLPPLP